MKVVYNEDQKEMGRQIIHLVHRRKNNIYIYKTVQITTLIIVIKPNESRHIYSQDCSLVYDYKLKNNKIVSIVDLVICEYESLHHDMVNDYSIEEQTEYLKNI